MVLVNIDFFEPGTSKESKTWFLLMVLANINFFEPGTSKVRIRGSIIELSWNEHWKMFFTLSKTIWQCLSRELPKEQNEKTELRNGDDHWSRGERNQVKYVFFWLGVIIELSWNEYWKMFLYLSKSIWQCLSRGLPFERKMNNILWPRARARSRSTTWSFSHSATEASCSHVHTQLRIARIAPNRIRFPGWDVSSDNTPQPPIYIIYIYHKNEFRAL